MTCVDFYPPRDMSKSQLYRIKTLAGINPREEAESSPHASEPALDDGRSSAPSGDFTERQLKRMGCCK